jgi:hypothetical protein
MPEPYLPSAIKKGAFLIFVFSISGENRNTVSLKFENAERNRVSSGQKFKSFFSSTKKHTYQELHLNASLFQCLLFNNNNKKKKPLKINRFPLIKNECFIKWSSIGSN